MVARDEKYDITQDNYRKITELKRRYPGLRVLLSVGNNDDDPETKEKYLTLVSLFNDINEVLNCVYQNDKITFQYSVN